MTTTSRVVLNGVANFAGRVSSSVLSLAFVPLYVSLLGVEVYGLLGIFVSIVGMMALLDMGMGATLTRELARIDSDESAAASSRRLVRTFECAYWATGMLLGAALALLAPVIATRWVHSAALPADVVQHSLMLMGVLLASQWPSSLYVSGFLGLQRHVELNVVRTIGALVQHLGAVAVLLWVSPSVLLFFSWQVVVALGTTVVLGVRMTRRLPAPAAAAGFDTGLLRKHWQFAGGVAAIALVTMPLNQIDKLALGRLLPLETFGLYVLAFNAANAIQILALPVFSAVGPRLTQLVAEGDVEKLSAMYHLACRFMASIVVPCAAAGVVFAPELLTLWLRDGAVVAQVSPMFRILLAGFAINALVMLPYALQLAYGWTRLALVCNMIALALVVPAIVWASIHHGGVGAAWVLLALNAGHFALQVPVMHRRLLPGEYWCWMRDAALLPLAMACALVIGARLLLPADAHPHVAVAAAMGALVLSVAGCLGASPRIRQELARHFPPRPMRQSP